MGKELQLIAGTVMICFAATIVVPVVLVGIRLQCTIDGICHPVNEW